MKAVKAFLAGKPGRESSVYDKVIEVKAPAKINWFLRITGKRQDGYHSLVTLMQCINLYDVLSFEYSERLELVSDGGIPAGDNSVYKAALFLKEFSSFRKGARISLQKNIPAGAGFGGGSSDAAFTLLALNRLWGLGLKKKALLDIASRIGSDVPFFIKGPVAMVEGFGEKVKPLKLTTPATLLVVKPSLSVSTAWAYSAYDSTPKLTKNPLNIKLLIQALNRQDFADLANTLDNELEPAVISGYPVIKQLKTELFEAGALFSAMTGSGSAVYGVFPDKEKAAEAAEKMKPHWRRVVETIV